MKKRLIAVIVAIALILVSLGVFLVVRHVRNNRPPELESLRPRVIALIDASHEINEIFWGEGLATYPRVYREYYTRVPFYLQKNGEGYTFSAEKTDNKLYYYTFTDAEVGEILAYQYCLKIADGEYVDVEKGDALTITDKTKYRYALVSSAADANAIFSANGKYYIPLPDYVEKEAEFYYSSADPEYYDYVRDDVAYLTVSAIKTKAEEVYAKDFLSSVYESMFTGIKVSESQNGTLYARYMDHTDSEGKGYLMKSNMWKPVPVSRIYLYDTMRMSEKRKSNATDVFIDIESYVPGKESEKQTITLSFTLQNGSWYLNSATY
ncbi:MAG: hypothetical protein IKA06_01135 [Clostridia bacterium]|nr:hypothetical protein [Clostridia bacterium]